jgi:hypothetical protein
MGCIQAFIERQTLARYRNFRHLRNQEMGIDSAFYGRL